MGIAHMRIIDIASMEERSRKDRSVAGADVMMSQ